jgi:hypothetical protein
LSIKPGDLVSMKTTEEPLFVLDVFEAPDSSQRIAPLLGKTMVRLRRATQGTEGISHGLYECFLEEVETLEQKKERMLKDYMSIRGTNDVATAIEALPSVDGKAN